MTQILDNNKKIRKKRPELHIKDTCLLTYKYLDVKKNINFVKTLNISLKKVTSKLF